MCLFSFYFLSLGFKQSFKHSSHWTEYIVAENFIRLTTPAQNLQSTHQILQHNNTLQKEFSVPKITTTLSLEKKHQGLLQQERTVICILSTLCDELLTCSSLCLNGQWNGQWKYFHCHFCFVFSCGVCWVFSLQVRILTS